MVIRYAHPEDHDAAVQLWAPGSARVNARDSETGELVIAAAPSDRRA